MVIPLPKFIGLIQAFILEKMPGPTLMSRDNIASMSVPSIATKNKELVFRLEQPTSIHKVALNFFQRVNRVENLVGLCPEKQTILFSRRFLTPSVSIA